MITEADFLAVYPWFSSFSEGVVLTEYLRQANARFGDFGEDAEEARRLYTAHKLTLYSASCLPEGASNPTPAQIAAAAYNPSASAAAAKTAEPSANQNHIVYSSVHAMVYPSDASASSARS